MIDRTGHRHDHLPRRRGDDPGFAQPRDDGGLAPAIADTAFGIEPTALDTLCEPFRQADASISRRFGGTGLGLAISRKLPARHQAMLEIESRPEAGTAVRIVFPKPLVIAPEPALHAD